MPQLQRGHCSSTTRVAAMSLYWSQTLRPASLKWFISLTDEPLCLFGHPNVTVPVVPSIMRALAAFPMFILQYSAKQDVSTLCVSLS